MRLLLTLNYTPEPEWTKCYCELQFRVRPRVNQASLRPLSFTNSCCVRSNNSVRIFARTSFPPFIGPGVAFNSWEMNCANHPHCFFSPLCRTRERETKGSWLRWGSTAPPGSAPHYCCLISQRWAVFRHSQHPWSSGSSILVSITVVKSLDSVKIPISRVSTDKGWTIFRVPL